MILAEKSPNNNPIVAILGTPLSSGNRGVLALSSSLTGLCQQTLPGAQTHFLLSHDKSEEIEIKANGTKIKGFITPYRLSPRSSFHDHLFTITAFSIIHRVIPSKRLRASIQKRNTWIRTASQAAIVGDVRGGDSFSDIYGFSRFFFGFLAAWSVILVRGSIVQFPQTYGPYKNPIARILARHLLLKSSSIFARDKKSKAVAEQLVQGEKEIVLSPDVAFSLTPEFIGNIQFSPSRKAHNGKNIIGINVNGLVYNGGYTRNNMFELSIDYPKLLKDLISKLLEDEFNEIWLIPHTFAPPGHVESDPDAARMLLASIPIALKHRILAIDSEYDQYEIKGVIGKCDFFIGSRMHACIAALSQGIPCIGIAYSSKFKGVFESVGVGDWVVEGKLLNNGYALEQCLSLYESRGNIRNSIKEKADAAKKTLVHIFKSLRPNN